MTCSICKMTLNDATDPPLSMSLRAVGFDERSHTIDEKVHFTACKECYNALLRLIKGAKR